MARGLAQGQDRQVKGHRGIRTMREAWARSRRKGLEGRTAEGRADIREGKNRGSKRRDFKETDYWVLQDAQEFSRHLGKSQWHRRGHSRQRKLSILSREIKTGSVQPDTSKRLCDLRWS